MTKQGANAELHIYQVGKRVGIRVEGSVRDLVNLIAVSMDCKELRDAFRAAVLLDLQHEDNVGRRDDYSLDDLPDTILDKRKETKENK